LLAGVFIWDGLSTLRDPQPHVTAARPVLEQVDRVAPVTEEIGAATLVRAHALVKVAAGSLLAFGVAPRLCATALAAGVLPSTLAHHRFWDEPTPERRRTQQLEFVKSLGQLGGLLLASADTEGKPSLAWRARRRRAKATRRATARLTEAVDHVGHSGERVLHAATHGGHQLADQLEDVRADLVKAGQRGRRRTTRRVEEIARREPN
jgi:uncharacterized membrane protein YphA (DoxX/SURF4 family)